MCFNSSLLSVVETLSRPELNEESDIKGGTEVAEAARTYMSVIDRIEVTGKMVM